MTTVADVDKILDKVHDGRTIYSEEVEKLSPEGQKRMHKFLVKRGYTKFAGDYRKERFV